MSYIDPAEVLADVESAIERQEYEGGSESVCDILQAVAPAVLDISIYLFVNAMTTVSSVIFLYGSNTKLASVSIIHMDEAGFTAAAAAMAVVIVLTSTLVKLIHSLLTHQLSRATQAWRVR